MNNVKLYDVPVIPGLGITSCTIEPRSGGGVRVTYKLEANQKLLALFKKCVNSVEAYAGYQKWHAADKCMIVLISCRDDESPAQATKLFTASVIGFAQAELEVRAAIAAATIAEIPVGTSHRDNSPAPVRQRHRSTTR